jgi:hypothetical protein
MATLDDQQKRWIIRRIARFLSKKQIAEDFKVVYELDLDSSQIATFDPTCAHGERLGEELKSYFWTERESYLADEEAIPESHRAHRIRRLADLLEHTLVSKNPFLIAQILEQIAKERGGIYEKKKPDGGAGDTLRELRALIGAPLDAGELGPIEAQKREEMRLKQQQEDRDAEARAMEELARAESNESPPGGEAVEVEAPQ